jgi:hypothetical protein
MSDTPKIATLADMQRTREVVAEAPSGLVYRIRPLNLERYALTGAMPAQLRAIAMRGANGIDELLAGEAAELLEHGDEVLAYMDSLVLQVVVEPELTRENIDTLPPVDYKWLSRIALGEEDTDGQGRRLWGRAPLTLWGTFRDEHGCTADCEACDRLSRPVAEVQ